MFAITTRRFLLWSVGWLQCVNLLITNISKATDVLIMLNPGDCQAARLYSARRAASVDWTFLGIELGLGVFG